MTISVLTMGSQRIFPFDSLLLRETKGGSSCAIAFPSDHKTPSLGQQIEKFHSFHFFLLISFSSLFSLLRLPSLEIPDSRIRAFTPPVLLILPLLLILRGNDTSLSFFQFDIYSFLTETSSSPCDRYVLQLHLTCDRIFEMDWKNKRHIHIDTQCVTVRHVRKCEASFMLFKVTWLLLTLWHRISTSFCSSLFRSLLSLPYIYTFLLFWSNIRANESAVMREVRYFSPRQGFVIMRLTTLVLVGVVSSNWV